MKARYSGVFLSVVVVIFLGLVGWAYVGEAMTSAAGSQEAAVNQGPYPTNYLPILANIPVPTETPPPSPTPPPPPTLHVGLQLRWDGEGYIYIGDYYWNPGTHLTRVIDQQVDADTVRMHAEQWYSPNPFGSEDESWYCHHNTTTNRAELCSTQNDPAWKWGYPWILPSDLTLVNEGTVLIVGQVFNVSGPHTTLNNNGEQIYFWRLVNRDTFLIHDSGGEWKQYVEKGDATLFYDFHDSRILLFSDVMRTLYQNGHVTDDSVRYDEWLTQFDGLVAYAVEMGFITAPDEGRSVLSTEGETLEVLEELGIDAAALGPHP